MRCAGLALRKPDRIVCYASSRLLRPFTLHCTRKRSAVEGEGAQQRKKGVADAGEPVGERSGWCGWGSWGSPGRGRVRICCKGAPGRDRRREEARNINDSPPAPRLDPGLCNRFGRTAPPRAPARTAAAAITPASGSTRPAPGRRDVHFALERALLTAHLEGEMHLSRAKCTSRRAQDRSAPPPRTASARTAPRRPGPRTTTPGEKAQWDGVSNVVTRPMCVVHMRSVGTPG